MNMNYFVSRILGMESNLYEVMHDEQAPQVL